MNHSKKRSKGSALVLVILLLAVLTTLISGLGTLTLTHYRSKRLEAQSHKAFYIAEACLEETRARVIMGLQRYINEGNVDSYVSDFDGFLDSLIGLEHEVASSQTIKGLGANSLNHHSERGEQSVLFSYTAEIGGMTRTLLLQFIFDDPTNFTPDTLATDKVEAVWMSR